MALRPSLSLLLSKDNEDYANGSRTTRKVIAVALGCVDFSCWLGEHAQLRILFWGSTVHGACIAWLEFHLTANGSCVVRLQWMNNRISLHILMFLRQSFWQSWSSWRSSHHCSDVTSLSSSKCCCPGYGTYILFLQWFVSWIVKRGSLSWFLWWFRGIFYTSSPVVSE